MSFSSRNERELIVLTPSERTLGNESSQRVREQGRKEGSERGIEERMKVGDTREQAVK